jgi:hypothetical protein
VKSLSTARLAADVDSRLWEIGDIMKMVEDRETEQKVAARISAWAPDLGPTLSYLAHGCLKDLK